MTIYLTELDPQTLSFPSPFEALEEPNGLLAFGGDLSPERVELAYQHGIFPWFGPGEPILWWSPAPRAVFYPKTFAPAKSLKKFQKKQRYSVSINKATAQVIDYCASVRPADETWLNEEMRDTYKRLAKKGRVHSVEVWQDETLIGGLYGVSVGQLFCGESMFSLKPNASKVALWYFCRHFARHDGQLIDCQVMNPHLDSLGAEEIEREDFMQQLLLLKAQSVKLGCFAQQILADE